MGRRKIEKEKAPHVTHRELCRIGAEWLFNHHLHMKLWKYVTVEMRSVAGEVPDIYGCCGFSSICIEVKTTHGDFVKDKNKYSRIHSERGCGNYRYYLCLKGVISIDELPDKWGLMEYNAENKSIEIIKEAQEIDCSFRSDLIMMCSIMRRMKIKPQIFDFSNKNNDVTK